MSTKTGDIITASDINELVAHLWYKIFHIRGYIYNNGHIESLDSGIAFRDSNNNAYSGKDESLNWTFERNWVDGNDVFNSDTLKITKLDNMETVAMGHFIDGNESYTGSVRNNINKKITDETSGQYITPTQVYNVLIYAAAQFSKIKYIKVNEYAVSSDNRGIWTATLMRSISRLVCFKETIQDDNSIVGSLVGLFPINSDTSRDRRAIKYTNPTITVNTTDAEDTLKSKFTINTFSKLHLADGIEKLFTTWLNNTFNAYDVKTYVCHSVCHSNWGSCRSRR